MRLRESCDARLPIKNSAMTRLRRRGGYVFDGKMTGLLGTMNDSILIIGTPAW
jgi:hypothetical protein